MKKTIILFVAMMSLFQYSYAMTQTPEEQNAISVVRGMLDEFWEKSDISLIDTYFTKDYEIELNGHKKPYKEFKEFATKYFANVESVKIKYENIFASSDKVAVRLTLDYVYKDGRKEKDYGIFIALIEGNKIARSWEFYIKKAEGDQDWILAELFENSDFRKVLAYPFEEKSYTNKH